VKRQNGANEYVIFKENVTPHKISADCVYGTVWKFNKMIFKFHLEKQNPRIGLIIEPWSNQRKFQIKKGERDGHFVNSSNTQNIVIFSLTQNWNADIIWLTFYERMIDSSSLLSV